MSDFRLRNHIPISGPATREPYLGDEPFIRVSMGFTPRWFNRRLGITFSEKWHLNPEYRYETLVKMKEYLYEIYPSVPQFKIQKNGNIEQTCATISGVHGIMVIPMLYGIKPIYRNDCWPDSIPGQYMDKGQIGRLSRFNLQQNSAVRQLLEQMYFIEKKWGKVSGYLNYQGILNIAMKIRGNDILTDMYDDPEFVHHFFNHIACTILDMSKLIQSYQRRTGFDVDLLSLSNCTINMISPSLYEEFILPYDQMLSKEYPRFGIHTCNWNITPYVSALAKIGKIGYIDMGMMSELKKVREAFPYVRRAVLYSPVLLEEKNMEEIKEDIVRVANELAPCDIVLADIENTVDDAKVNKFLRIVEVIGMNK